jgi:hypothetical protein
VTVRQKRSKFRVIKILTSNFFVLKILQPRFAKPAPVKPFRGVGGRGDTLPTEILPKRTRLKRGLKSQSPNYFSARIPQVIFHSRA